MKSFVAVVLFVVSIAATEPQKRGYQSSQASTDGSYPASGWKPIGPAFRLPVRFQKSQVPPSAYGPPQQEYGPPDSDVTTTEAATTTTETTTEITTEQSEAENIKLAPRTEKLRSEKTETAPAQASPVYVVIPQPQAQQVFFRSPLKAFDPNLVAISRPEKLVEVREPNAVPVQAVPALAKIQAAPAPVLVEQYPQSVQYQQLQAFPGNYASYLSRTAVVSPYSSSFVQIYQ